MLSGRQNLAVQFNGITIMVAVPQLSSYESADFITLGQSIKSTFPNTLISPYLTLGGTDSKNFDGLSAQTFRFLPIPLTKEDLPRIHGINERIHGCLP